MHYLVDGHNLIPKAGLSLADPDDEETLIRLLQDFCRRKADQVEVYFDGAPAGFPRQKRYGSVTACSVPLGTPADAAIERRLTGLGNQARNWTVVSSDHRVQAAARAVHARVLGSAAFAERIAPHGAGEKAAEDREVSSSEVEEMLRVFGEGKDRDS